MDFDERTKLFHTVADELARRGRDESLSDELRGRFFTAAYEVRRLTQTFYELSSKLQSEG